MDRISKALERARQGSSKSRIVREVKTNNNKPIEYFATPMVSLSIQRLRENRIILGGEDSSIIDTYGLLRTRVLKAMRKNGWKTIGITGPDPSVGKTVTSINLAISIAMDFNYSVLLVDADLRRPGISNALGLEPEVGLNDYLATNKNLEEILVRTQVEHLVIAPTKRVEHGSSELLSSPRMKHFIEEAKERYSERVVIFDLPPVLVADDVVSLSQHIDTLLLVVEDSKTQTVDLKRASELLHDVNILGVVLNKGQISGRKYEYYQ